MVSVLNISIKDYIKQINSNKIDCFDIPREFQNNIEIIKAARKKKLRYTDKSGYNFLSKTFFVDEIWLKRHKEGKDIVYEEKKIKSTFLSFGEYYDFLEGKVYENSCYYQYTFSKQEIELYNLNVNMLNTSAFIQDKLSDYSFDILYNEQEEKNKLKEQKSKQAFIQRKKWLHKFLSCKTYEEFYSVVSRYKKSSCQDDIKFYFYMFIQHNKEKAFNIIMQFISTGEYPSRSIEQFLCQIYDRNLLRSTYKYQGGDQSTNSRHNSKYKKLLKKFDSTLVLDWQALEHKPSEEELKDFIITNFICRYGLGYDTSTCFFCIPIECRRYIDKKLDSSFCGGLLYFETFDEFVNYLGGNLSGCDLSQMPFDKSIDFSLYTIDENTKLPSEKGTDITVAYEEVFKVFNKNDNKFVVTKKWYNKNNKCLLDFHREFDYFCDFTFFLGNDLSGSNLGECDGIENLNNIDNILLKNATLQSAAADKLGIVYDKFEYKHSTNFALVELNETQSLPKLQENRETLNYDANQEMLKHNYKVYYISDLHLVHRVHNAKCKSEVDIIQLFTKLITNLKKDISYDYSESVLLIGGDTSSDFNLFEMFVNILAEKISVPIIFILGNHELWDGDSCEVNEIIKDYRCLIENKGMHLIQNELLYITGDIYNRTINTISATDILTKDKSQIRECIKTSRLIIFGGIGYSGYNNNFNANNGIYRGALNREQEIIETSVIENLYNHICEYLPDRDIIIFTHMPLTDWCLNSEYKPNYIYISGHTHRNYFYDDGDIHIYSDNQIGYLTENPRLKHLYINCDYDYFVDYDDGIYPITRGQYVDFMRGKNFNMEFNREINELLMLKKNGYYCFIHKAKNKKLSILNGGAWKGLMYTDINYYYDNMDIVIDFLNSPLTAYTKIQKEISSEIIKIGGSGKIHGCIIDIDFYNHVYVNPSDLKITGYWASDIINKVVYDSIPKLLEERCPQIFSQYQSQLQSTKRLNEISIYAINDNVLSKKINYVETDIYQMSREIKKMQKLQSNILSYWKMPTRKSLEEK